MLHAFVMLAMASSANLLESSLERRDVHIQEPEQQEQRSLVPHDISPVPRIPLVHAPFIDHAWEDFKKHNLDASCYVIYTSQDARYVYVMFLRLETALTVECGPGVRYTFNLDGGLLSKVWIR